MGPGRDGNQPLVFVVSEKRRTLDATVRQPPDGGLVREALRRGRHEPRRGVSIAPGRVNDEFPNDHHQGKLGRSGFGFHLPSENGQLLPSCVVMS